MRVLALVPNQVGHAAGQRGSIELWQKVLSASGIDIEFAPFESDHLRSIIFSSGQNIAKAAEMLRCYWSRFSLLDRLDEFDAVFVYREAALIGPAILERLIARKKPIIYQLDDPLFVPYRSPKNGYFSYLKFFGKIKEIVKLSSVVIVNSTQIQEFAIQYNSNVWLIPSIVDTSSFTFDPRYQDISPVTVGWSGSPTTAGNVKILEQPLQRISRVTDHQIHFIGAEDFDLKDVKYTAQLWNEKSEVRDLRNIQIGLVPLPMNAWNPFKFIMKTAQYMALGIVPVGTPMASNPEVIRHGENGFLASTNEEWFEYIELLATDKELRCRLSKNAATDAESKYSLNANKDRITSAFLSSPN